MLAHRLQFAIRPLCGPWLIAAGFAVLVLGASAWISSSLPLVAVHWAKVLIVAPVIEEMFFRGVVQSSLRRLGGPWVAISITAIGFGLAHLGTATTAHSVLVIAPAVGIGWVYDRSRSIPLCIALHAVCNAYWFGIWSN